MRKISSAFIVFQQQSIFLILSFDILLSRWRGKLLACFSFRFLLNSNSGMSFLFFWKIGIKYCCCYEAKAVSWSPSRVKYDYRFRRKINYQSCNDFWLGLARRRRGENWGNLLILPLKVTLEKFHSKFRLQVEKFSFLDEMNYIN